MVAQGGLGAYPWMVAQVLLLYGVAKEAGLAAGWIGWLAQTVMIIVVSIFCLVIASFMKDSTANIQSESIEETKETSENQA